MFLVKEKGDPEEKEKRLRRAHEALRGKDAGGEK